MTPLIIEFYYSMYKQYAPSKLGNQEDVVALILCIQCVYICMLVVSNVNVYKYATHATNNVQTDPLCFNMPMHPHAQMHTHIHAHTRTHTHTHTHTYTHKLYSLQLPVVLR